MDICIDFDGTCVTHAYPSVGKDIGAQSVLLELVANGHNLILFTMRSDGRMDGTTPLTDALDWFRRNDIPLYGIQSNPTQHTWTQSPKAYGHIYIDDAALGCPLMRDKSASPRPFVDWVRVREILVQAMVIK
ncbi:MAG: hypothetical protein H6550_16325 [Chitinophagales bacterium]|nr:hypothetical protein [Chitinophagales bacterium]